MWRALGVALFLVLLCAPVAQQRWHLVPVAALDENRLRAPLPSMQDARWDRLPEYFARWERHLEDHYGFRDVLIRLKNELRYRLFGTATHIIIGRKGWLFYKSEQAEMAMAEAAYEEQRAALFDRLTAFRDELRARGIDLYVVPVPQKQSVYPEFFPAASYPRPSPNYFDKLRADLAERDINWIDPMPVFARAKRIRRVFYKTDFHWNEFGAAFFGQHLAETIAERTGKPLFRALTVEPVWQDFASGGQSRALGLIFDRPEVTAGVQRRLEGCARVLPADGFDWGLEATDACGPPDARLPSTLVYGDSFSDYFTKTDLPAYFSRFVRRHHDYFALTYESLPPDVRIVVLEFTETALHRMLVDSRLDRTWWPASLSAPLMARTGVR